MLQTLGGDINFALSSILPIGAVVHSMLTEAQFQGEASTNWILADGRSVSGSTYSIITGFSNVPDLRGVFLRGKNNGRTDYGLDAGNEAGDVPLGTPQGDRYRYHGHLLDVPLIGTIAAAIPTTVNEGTIAKDTGSEYLIQGIVGTLGSDQNPGNETQPRNVTVNIFIRVN
jgi:hypothetical protein